MNRDSLNEKQDDVEPDQQEWLVKGQTIVEKENQNQYYKEDPVEKVDQSVQHSRDYCSAEVDQQNMTYVSFLSPLRRLSQNYESEEQFNAKFKAPTTLNFEIP